MRNQGNEERGKESEKERDKQSKRIRVRFISKYTQGHENWNFIFDFLFKKTQESKEFQWADFLISMALYWSVRRCAVLTS
jgi:hypothetical protein